MWAIVGELVVAGNGGCRTGRRLQPSLSLFHFLFDFQPSDSGQRSRLEDTSLLFALLKSPCSFLESTRRPLAPSGKRVSSFGKRNLVGSSWNTFFDIYRFTTEFL